MLDNFIKLGFTESEGKVYLALADIGKSSVTVLAKKASLPRSTTYSVLESLADRGLVAVEQDRSSALYRINQPSALVSMVQAEKHEIGKQLERKEAAARELATAVEPLFRAKNYSVPRLQFFEGTKNVNRMLYDYELEWQKSIAREDFTWWGYQDVEFVEQYRVWLDHYWSGLKPAEKIWLFSNQSGTEEKLKGKVARRIIKQLPAGVEFSSTVWVLGEYVVTIMTRQKPHYAFMLKDAVFAANQRAVYQLLWMSLRVP